MKQKPDIETTIHLHLEDDPFARVRKQMLNDTTLSWKAKGVLAYLLGKPQGWKLRLTDLVNRSKDGDCAVKSAVKELRKAGYLKMQQVRQGGKISEWVYYIADRPIFLSINGHEPKVENRLVAIQHVANRPLNKNDYTKNDYTKNDSDKGVAKATAVESQQPELTQVEGSNLGQPPQSQAQATQDSKPKSDHRMFIEAWETAFAAKHGNAYRFDGGKDAKAVKLLLASGDSIGDLVVLAGRCWERAAEYPFGSALTIAGFNSKLNEIRVRIKIAPKVQFRGPVQSARPAGRRPEAREEGRQLDAITKL